MTCISAFCVTYTVTPDPSSAIRPKKAEKRTVLLDGCVKLDLVLRLYKVHCVREAATPARLDAQAHALHVGLLRYKLPNATDGFGCLPERKRLLKIKGKSA